MRGEEHDPAAVGRLDPFDRDLGAFLGGRVALVEGLFQGGQGDHFAADLEEPLQTPAEVDEPVLVQLDQVAGVVPAVAGELDEGVGPVVVQVAGEDRRAADQQQAARAGR